jgi:hypothetical protein
MMAMVYEKAKGVLAYLGDHFEGCERAVYVIYKTAGDPALHLIEKEAGSDVNIKDPGKDLHEPDCHMSQIQLGKGKNFEGVGLEDPELVECVRTFLNTPWMTRAWTIQGFTCAREATLLYGRKAVSGEEMMRFYRHRGDHATCCQPEPMSQTWVAF